MSEQSQYSAGGSASGRWARVLPLLVLPVAFLAVELWTRATSGPFWMWSTVDPSYYYVLDSLNLVNLTTPGHPFHPGTTVQWLGAIILKVMHPLASGREIADLVLADPEGHLRVMGNVLLALIAGALFVAGLAAQLVWKDILPALIIQTGPFLSMLMVNHAMAVKPEPLLIVTMLAISAITVLALRPGAIPGRAGRFAVAFGIAAGFGVATKITSVPVYIMPIFLLGRLRPVIIYGAASAAAVIVFTLPAAGAYGQMLSWFTQVFVASGAYETGARTIIDPGTYFASIYQLVLRPVFHVVLILSLIGLAVAWRRKRRGVDIPDVVVRALIGIVVAQLAHVLVIAKQPAAFYMIPAFMLIPLAAALLYALASSAPKAKRPIWQKVVAVLLLALAVSQSFSIVRNDRELTERRAASATVDEARFASCARIYFYSASSPTFALYLGDWWTGNRFRGNLKARTAANDFWFEPKGDEIRDWDGHRNTAEILAAYPCVFMRGQVAHAGSLRAHLAAKVPDFRYETKCSTRHEAILTAGVDCQGRIK